METRKLKHRNGPRLTNSSPERQYFDRAVGLENEKADLAADLKALWDEARRDPEMDAKTLKAIRRAVRLHVEDPERRQRREQTELDAKELLARLGVLADLPLGQAAIGTAAPYDPETGEVA